MARLQDLFSGSGAFALYFAASLILLAAFVTIYNLITPYREMLLIRSGNKAAALSLGAEGVWDRATEAWSPSSVSTAASRTTGPTQPR